MVVSSRQLLDAVLDRRGHPISLFKIDQGFVREGSELVVAEPVDLGLKFCPDDVVVHASLHEHIHVLDVVVATRNHLEQENILVGDQSDSQPVRHEERLAALAHPIGQDELVRHLLVEDVQAASIGVLDATRRTQRPVVGIE